MCSALTISFLNSIAVDKLLRDALCGVPFLLRVFLFSKHINPNRSLDRICLDLLLSSCFLTAFVRLPTSALSFHLAVARYAFDETSAHLLNNRTKSVKESNDRFGINHAHTTEKKQPLEKTLSTNLTYRKEKSYSWFSAK